MSGDFEPWNNNPAKNEAPKPELVPVYDYKKEMRAEKIRVLLWLLGIAGFVLFVLYLWHSGWRFHLWT